MSSIQTINVLVFGQVEFYRFMCTYNMLSERRKNKERNNRFTRIFLLECIYNCAASLWQTLSSSCLRDPTNFLLYLGIWRFLSQMDNRFVDPVMLFFERASSNSCPFPSLLPCEGAFSDIVDSLVQETKDWQFFYKALLQLFQQGLSQAFVSRVEQCPYWKHMVQDLIVYFILYAIKMKG